MGRTARAVREGVSITLCNDAERTRLRKQYKKMKVLAVPPKEIETANAAISSMWEEIERIF